MKTVENECGSPITETPRLTAHQYRVLKENKCDTIYELVTIPKEYTFLTSLVKLEQFQGFSRANNIELYFRIRDQSSWRKSSSITGLYKTCVQGTYRGDKKDRDTRTLIIFQFHPDGEQMTVYTFPTGYYPGPAMIDTIAAHL